MRDASNVLEFDIVKKRLREFAVLGVTKERIDNLTYSNDYYHVEEELEATKEALEIVNSHGRCPIEYIHNIKSWVDKALKKGVLSCEELYHIATQADGIVLIRNFANNISADKYPTFFYLVNTLVPLKNLKERIFSCIDPNFEVYDKASPALNRIRKDIIKKQGEVRHLLESLLKSKASYLSDSLITVRNDRLVLPVKSAYKYNLGGIIHDESQSQQTSFVEPEGALLLNSQIESLRQQELLEIERILRNLSNLVADNSEILLRNQKMIEELDYIFAKGSYGLDIGGLVANLSKEQIIELKSARHPLINKKEAIANNFELGGNNNKIYLITGPNTGGKTVALKTVGLLAIMNQAGLALPCDSSATLGIFGDFYVDIGDEQSIEQSLSTFSSHMSKLTRMVKEANSKSLVLIDEIGGGTDPSEGEAIAMSALSRFHELGSLMLATTHYSNLKSFAIEQGYISNASMIFDQQNLRPTYRLQVGVSGHSYALEIASNLGYPSDLVSKARSYKKHYMSEAGELVEKLEKEIERQNQEKEKIDAILKENEKMKEEIKLQKEEITKEKEKIKKEASEQVDRIVNEAKETIKNVLKELNKENLKPHEVIALKAKIEAMSEENEEIQVSSDIFNKGDLVKVLSANKVGRISDIRGDEYLVNIGSITVRAKKENLAHTNDVKSEIKPHHESTIETITVPVELNIIGEHVEDGLLLLDKYLDNARRVHLKTVRIIHGFGSGALRNAVHRYLKSKTYIKEFHPGGAYDGGSGATIVVFKD